MNVAMNVAPNVALAPAPQAAQSGAHLTAAEQLLEDATARALRQPSGRLALVLHVSRLRPPSPRPHHARIARALLEDTAQRHDGQVFPMRNGDLVLLCASANAAMSAAADAPAILADTLAHIYGADAPAGGLLTSLWRLDHDNAAYQRYLADRANTATASVLPEPAQATSPAALQALEDVLATTDVPTLLGAQTAIILRGGKHVPLTARLAPLFRELTFSFAALHTHQDTAGVIADPYLFRHFAARLDARMLAYLTQDLTDGGALCRTAGLPVHLNLTLEGVVSPAFARLVRAARQAQVKFGVEISLMEAAADLQLTGYARDLLRMAGFTLALDGIDHAALLLAAPAKLAPDFVKLIWSTHLRDANPATTAAFQRLHDQLGPDRIVLARADSEQALIWGQSHGITRYQGHFLDRVRAACANPNE